MTGLRREGGGWLAHTSAEPRRGDAIVLANGVAAAELLAGLRVRLPVHDGQGLQPAPSTRSPSGPRHSIYLEAPRVAISAFDGGARVSGVLELGAKDLALSERRLSSITAAAARALPGWLMPERGRRDWAGMRALSPDGLPLIGALAGIDGTCTSRRGTLRSGSRLAPLSGELLAQLILQGGHSPLLDAFAPGRFEARGRSLGVRPPAGSVNKSMQESRPLTGGGAMRSLSRDSHAVRRAAAASTWMRWRAAGEPVGGRAAWGGSWPPARWARPRA